MNSIEKLNNGLARVASVKKYPKSRKPYVSKNTRGKLFKVGVLHSKELTEEALKRNRRGYVNSQMSTVAHAPSMYHWLFHRCGIPFEETQEYVKHGYLKVDDVVVTNMRDLESQLDWETFEELDIQVRSLLPSAQQPGQTEGNWVPALKRALHRSYHAMNFHPGISMSSAVENPKSFVHRMPPYLGPQPTISALGLNVLRPVGFMDSMRGLGIVTNDVSIVRYWNNEFLGNYGVFDVRFISGTPNEVIENACADLQKALAEGVGAQLSGNFKIPCSCNMASIPHVKARDTAALLHPKIALSEKRILASTPLFPYRIAQKIKKNGGFVDLIRSGPFTLNAHLMESKVKPLTVEEMALLFTFERRLKSNRLILSLREFTADEGEE
ncbi:hypothetical protein, conserved [Angomonas deanei]|uniref:Uncharacterized protein n=1 Tax=Angomonas deanei TaxID=59799 RepID=A0A7G2C001_9TRYP|nr:hypothetical protein, conserved [Angomonas deanei]